MLISMAARIISGLSIRDCIIGEFIICDICSAEGGLVLRPPMPPSPPKAPAAALLPKGFKNGLLLLLAALLLAPGILDPVGEAGVALGGVGVVVDDGFVDEEDVDVPLAPLGLLPLLALLMTKKTVP